MNFTPDLISTNTPIKDMKHEKKVNALYWKSAERKELKVQYEVFLKEEGLSSNHDSAQKFAIRKISN